MLAKAILVHGVIGYKFCWLLPSEDHNQGAPAGHESNGTTVRDHWEDMNQLRHQLGTYQYLFLVWSLFLQSLKFQGIQLPIQCLTEIHDNTFMNLLPQVSIEYLKQGYFMGYLQKFRAT